MASSLARLTDQQAVADDVVVKFIDVQKTYDGKTLVIDELNLEVHRGEFLTLLGPSGSGKTSSLMMVAGFEMPTSGDILLNGRSITRLPPYKRNIGMVFQNYALFPNMTVGENLAFPLEARKLPKAEIALRIERALDMVQLADYAKRRTNQLSGGQQQRVALARALVFEPSIVLMDEPLGALDRHLREAMQFEIKRIHESLGVTIIYVTHDQNEALTMSDRIAVMNEGKIQQIAPPADLYERPETAFVARFIGENNRLPGRARAIESDVCVVEVVGGLVRALPVHIAAVGDETTLSLRPERVVLNPTPEECNVFEGVVRELIYLGDHIRVRLAVCGTENFIVKVPNSQDRETIAIGQRVKVGWRVEDCRALEPS